MSILIPSYPIVMARSIIVSLKILVRLVVMNKNAREKMLKIIISILVIIAVLVLSVARYLYYEVKSYFYTHTWATVSVDYESEYDETGNLKSELEYLKGDKISFADVTLTVTKIDHKGRVDFKVSKGELYDSSDNIIKKGSLSLNEVKEYKLNKAKVRLKVTSNRYQ
jgi:hypothetical protein